MNIKYFLHILLAGTIAMCISSCLREEILAPAEYEEGLDTRITLKIGAPERDVATRADMPEGADDEVNSLWIGIFSESSGKCTFAKLYEADEVPVQLQKRHGQFAKLEIRTLSGKSFIVAVANPVDNYGYQYDGSGEVTREALDALLPKETDTSFTWEKYKNIAIRQLDINDVNTPIGNLVMSGIYSSSTVDPSAKSWEEANYTSVDIPTLSSNGKTVTLDGAIHLRRLISQVKFKIQAVDYTGEDDYKRSPVTDPETEEIISQNRRILQIIPQSFQVRNVPYTSWLHERKAASSPGDIQGSQYTETNSGDVIKLKSSSIQYDGALPLKANYRNSAWFNGNQYLIPHYKINENGVQDAEPEYYTFDFWMLENKRWASYDLGKNYDRREKEVKTDLTEKVGYDYEKNTGIYTALCSPTVPDPANPPTMDQVPETMNNCASFVEIRCRVIYTDDGLDAIKKHEDYEEVEYRSAEAIYTIHLGGVENNWNDFTHRRNHVYTYNVTVMDIDRIIVEARYDDEPRPGIEGVVTDVVNPPFEADCHYAVFNIQMSNLERTGGGIVQKEGDLPNTGGDNGGHDVNGSKYERGIFPFRIRYYDENNFARYIDQNNVKDYTSKKDKLYWTWVEFRPTTGPDDIADYKPYDYDWEGNPDDEKKGRTFRLDEVHKIFEYRHPDDNSQSKTDPDRPDEDDTKLRWYTVFVSEYVYETELDEGENNFVNYVNLSPRMCWINTLFRSSIDDESNYIRSKYVVRQPSIQSFYANIPYVEGDKSNDFNAIGMEHINETFGFNLRWDDVPTEFPGDDRTHNLQNNNGRHNTLLYIFDEGHKTRGLYWNEYMHPNRLQYITDINTESNQYDVSYQLKEAPYLPAGHEKREPYYVPAIYTYTNGNSLGTSDINKQYYLRILDACMNRNRDNNGNGVIDPEEIRWYVPASSEIIDFVLGRNSLETPLLDYNLNYRLDSPAPTDANDIKVEQKHQANTRFHYATSNQRVLWAEEGATINPEVDELTGSWNLPPQNVRCVRALGTDLKTDSNADLTPAFTTNAEFTVGTDGKRNYSSYATKIYPTYYEQKNQRSYTSDVLEPHQEMTPQNRLCHYGFEFSKELFNFRPTTIQVWVEQGERTIPEGWYADDGSGEYLGIPEWKEGGGTRHEGGMYLPDPDSYSPDPAPGKKKFDGFWVGGEDYGGHYYKPDMTKYGGDNPDNEPTDGKYAWWDRFPDEETKHDGAWYRPDLTQYGGNGQEPDKEGKFDWWKEEELPVESTKHDGAWYNPDVDKYGGNGTEPNKEGKYGWWDEKELPDESTKHDGAWYNPDVNKFGGNNRNNKPTDGQYKWWDEFWIGRKVYTSGYYRMLEGTRADTQIDDSYEYWNEFWVGGTPRQSGWYKPDLSTYKAGSENNSPGDGYVWWEETTLKIVCDAGWYLPDETTRSDTPFDGGYWWDGYWDGTLRGQHSGFFLPDKSTYREDPKDGWFYWDSFTLNGDTYAAGYYRPDPSTEDGWNHNEPYYKSFSSVGGFYDGDWHDGAYYKPIPDSRDPGWNALPPVYKQFSSSFVVDGETIDAGWYKADYTSPQGNANQSGYKQYPNWNEGGTKYEEGWYKLDGESRMDWNGNDPFYKQVNRTWYDGGTKYGAGWYQPLDPGINVGNPNDNPKNSDPSSLYQWFDTWYDKYYPSGWYQPSDPGINVGNPNNNPKNSDPNSIYQWFDTWYDEYYPEGWYKPDLNSKDGDQWNNPNNNASLKNFHWFDTWYDKYYPAGWYQPDLDTEAGSQYNQPNPMGNYKWFDEWHEGGTYYQEGYYGPDPTSRTTDGNNFWNADPRYKRFETFWDSPSGYYGSDGSYLGPNRNSAPDPAWADKNPKWVEEHTEPVPEGGAYEEKFVEGHWQDAGGATRDLFSYNEGNFVRDHGTTLAAANKICKEDMKEKGYGNGWRLPTMKEAALIKIEMDNAGVYKGFVGDDYLTYEKFQDPKSGYDVGNFIACTFREFGVTEPQSRAEQDGYYTGIYYAEDPNEVQPGDWSGQENASPILGRIACITTGWNRHFYIRCVRDLPSPSE